ncbi:MAG: protein BatD [Bacteroidia bacterium]|nr:MAG: protein BatD [Bacteroidia bacterium]
MKGIISTVFILICTFLAKGQEIVFTTIPAAKKVGIQDPFEVQYVIRNAKRVESFDLPPFKDIQILSGPSQSTRFSEVNGHRTVSIELTYVFKAKKRGTIVIPGGVINVEGREMKSNNVPIEVIEGSVLDKRSKGSGRNPFDDEDPFASLFEDEDPFASMQRQHQQMMQMLQQQMKQDPFAGRSSRQQTQSNSPQLETIGRNQIKDNLFIRVEADKKTVNLGEQVTVSYKLYTRLPMEINLTKLPSLNGFWSQDFKIPQPPKPVKEIFNGKEFQVFEIKRTALFPTQNGLLELDAAHAEGVVRILKKQPVRQQHTFEEDPFFSSFFGSMMMSDPDFNSAFGGYEYEDVAVKLQSAPIQIKVNEIPTENRPASYNGAVGTYTLESTLDKADLTTDDVANITLKVAGTGNLKMIGAPIFKVSDQYDVFEPKANDTITNTNDIIAGVKTFTYSIAPTAEGKIIIPPTEFTFFDPHNQSFKTLTTPTYTLNVKQGKGESSAKHQLPKDIHDIKSTNLELSKKSKIILPYSSLYWSGFALPLLAYLGLIVYKRKNDELASNSTLAKHKRANKVAMKRLETAESYLKQSAQSAFYEETSKAVWLYLSDKLNIPLSALSKEVAIKKLQEHKVTNDLQTELLRIADECEMALYAADRGTMRMHQTYSDALRLIGDLEDKLS